MRRWETDPSTRQLSYPSLKPKVGTPENVVSNYLSVGRTTHSFDDYAILTL